MTPYLAMQWRVYEMKNVAACVPDLAVWNGKCLLRHIFSPVRIGQCLVPTQKFVGENAVFRETVGLPGSDGSINGSYHDNTTQDNRENRNFPHHESISTILNYETFIISVF
jgi:hypothetical protein